MTQKYKKNNSPTIQNSVFSSFPDVSQPNLSDFPDVLQPDLSGFPGVFWFKHGGNMFGASKKWAPSVMRSPIRVMWKTLVVFGDRD